VSTISEAGVYDLTSTAYHGDPVEGGSLSSTGARRLLPPSAPALFKHWRDNGQEPRNAFDIGHAVHKQVLGVGEPIQIVEFDSYNTKAARAARDEAHAAKRIPLLQWEAENVNSMVLAVHQHPVAGPLFAREGPVEQTLVWRDRLTGVWLRAMLDKQIPGQRLVVVDLKTCKSAEPAAISSSVASYGYHQQGDFYLSGIRALNLHGGVEPAFVLVFVEKNPPCLVTVVQLDPHALMWGGRLNRKAIDTYHRCVTSGEWPGYATEVISIDLPYWTTRQLEDAHARGDFDEGNAA
jgi:hypothetical protein